MKLAKLIKKDVGASLHHPIIGDVEWGYLPEWGTHILYHTHPNIRGQFDPLVVDDSIFWDEDWTLKDNFNEGKEPKKNLLDILKKSLLVKLKA